jgi:hypothetical protein
MTQEQIQKEIISSATPISDGHGSSNYFVLTQAAIIELAKSIHNQAQDYSCYAYNSGLTDGKDCGSLDNRW